VVCRANEVRSRIIEGYLRKRYPQFEIRSFGTDVVEGKRISSQLIREMNYWGVEINQTSPTSAFSEIDFIRESDMVISADIEISEKLVREDIISINICDYAADELHMPFDPIDFSSDKYFANAAKVLHCTARLISEAIEQKPKTDSIWAHTSSEKSLPDSVRPGAIVIDARLRRSSNEALPPGEARFFEEQELLNGSLLTTLHNRTRLYLPKFEFREPEKALLSNDWSDFVSAVSNFGPVDVVTTPLTASRRFLWDPYLASILAYHVEFL